jgi:saccharopine dehydrogenase (NAD+, L-lysine-forming)
MRIFIRAETYPNEFRTPLVPYDVRTLLEEGHSVIVESSETRCFTDEEYMEDGAIISYKPWYQQDPQTLILGLKELEHLDQLNGHTHVYFSHALKGQAGSTEILDAFRKSNSTLYDLEDFCRNGKRILSFGFYAGVVGAFLGVKAFGSELGPLRPTTLTELSACEPITAKIGIAGAGRTSKGVQRILDSLGLSYTVLKRGDLIDPTQFDIFFNCICLSPEYKETWNTDTDKPLLIVDISCDASKSNSPLPPIRTTWSEPVYRSGNLSVIAIDNLPSLIPRESSMDFSSCMVDLIDFHGGPLWVKAGLNSL